MGIKMTWARNIPLNLANLDMARYKRKMLLKPQKNSALGNRQIKALQMPYFSVFYEQNSA